MKFTTRELVLIAVFGALWGAVEITLGSVLKSLHVPFSGVILASIALLILLIARLFVPKRGSTLFVGVVALLLKLFSLGGVIIGPMVAILAEALLAEMTLSGLGVSQASFMLAAALGLVWSLAQPFITGPLLYGRALVDVWVGVIHKSAQALGLSPESVGLAAGLIILIYLAAGAFTGWLAWRLGARLRARNALQRA